jgi:hypothetical protein
MTAEVLMERGVFPEYLTEKTVSNDYPIGVSTLRNHRHLNKGIPYHKFGRKILYKRSDIEAFLKRNRVETADSRAL